MLRLDTGRRIVVIGDVMVDEYLIGHVSRTSPEAPVPVVSMKERYCTLGGAANVANNLKALGYEPYLIGVVGEKSSTTFKRLLKEQGITDEGIIVSKDYVTTTKTRVMADGQHVCRVDEETVMDLTEELMNEIEWPESIDLVVFSDYGKGVCTSRLVQKVREMYDCPVIADPKNEFEKYAGVDVLKPNRTEAFGYANRVGRITDSIDEIAYRIMDIINPRRLVMTVGAEGAYIYGNSKTHVPPVVTKDMVDITGAGDTVSAVLAACLVSGYGLVDAVRASNYAASKVIRTLGVSTVNASELKKVEL